MLLPVWIEISQLECCMPDFTVGAMLTAALVIEDADISPARSRPLGWRNGEDGEIDFVAYASPLEAPGRLPTILDLGECRMGTRDVAISGLVEGTGEVLADWHGTLESPGIDADRLNDAIQATGIVQRIFRVPVIYKQRGKVLVPSGRREPVEVATTAARQENDLLLLDYELVPNPH